MSPELQHSQLKTEASVFGRREMRRQPRRIVTEEPDVLQPSFESIFLLT